MKRLAKEHICLDTDNNVVIASGRKGWGLGGGGKGGENVIMSTIKKKLVLKIYFLLPTQLISVILYAIIFITNVIGFQFV